MVQRTPHGCAVAAVWNVLSERMVHTLGDTCRIGHGPEHFLRGPEDVAQRDLRVDLAGRAERSTDEEARAVA